MNAPSNNSPVTLPIVRQYLTRHALKCSDGAECDLCKLLDLLGADPEPDTSEFQADAEVLRRQTEDEQRRERQVD